VTLAAHSKNTRKTLLKNVINQHEKHKNTNKTYTFIIIHFKLIFISSDTLIFHSAQILLLLEMGDMRIISHLLRSNTTVHRNLTGSLEPFH